MTRGDKCAETPSVTCRPVFLIQSQDVACQTVLFRPKSFVDGEPKCEPDLLLITFSSQATPKYGKATLVGQGLQRQKRYSKSRNKLCKEAE